MMDDRKEIKFTVTHAGEVQTVNTYPGEFRNLMVLLNNTIYLEGFGECGGQGRCATCLVEASGIRAPSSSMERNEKSTISKIDGAVSGLRLSCQIFINEDIRDSQIEIPDE